MASGNQGQARDASASAQANPWNFSTMAKSDRNKTGLKDQDQEVMGQGPQAAKSLFDSKGAIGKQFTTEGAIGGTAQAIGGPLKEDGMVGKQFTDQGSIGGSVQSALGDQRKE